MSEPSCAKTVADIVLRVAEKAGIAYYGTDGQGKACVPIDQFNIDQCLRIVNDGISRFIAHSPADGWNWMRRRYALTLDAEGDGALNIDTDPARYMLPEDFGGANYGELVFNSESGVGPSITWVSEDVILRRRAISLDSGYPIMAAVRPYTPSSSTGAGRRWELLLYPQPDAAYVILLPYTMYFANLNMATGIATGGVATTLVDSTRKEVNDYFNGWVLTVIAGTGVGQTATITDYTAATGTFTFTGLSGGTTPDTTSAYMVLPPMAYHPAGMMFDSIIISACLCELEAQVTEINEGFTDRFFNVDLPQAKVLDARLKPRRIGNIGGCKIQPLRHNYNTVTFEG